MRNTVSVATLLGALASTSTAGPMESRDVITAIGESATDMDIRFQPVLDYDTDGCYNTAAISPDGTTNPGHGATGTPQGDCRDPHQLENSNVYSRARCNNGICAIMYEHYFEKDQAVAGSFLGGHRHDWENIVVFVQGDTILRVSPSCHGGYPDSRSDFLRSDDHPQMVYHKDGAGTHCFRFANDDDVNGVENYLGYFWRSPLLSWDSWPDAGLRDNMLTTWNGGVGPKLDDEFGDSLSAAAGDGVPGFDPYLDA